MADYDANAVLVRKQRWRDFYRMDGKKAFQFVVEYEGGVPPRPHLWPNKKRERIDWVLTKYECLLNQSRWLHDDMIPHLDLLTGTEIFAEAFGCRVHRPEDAMPSVLPLVHSAAEAARLAVPELDGSTLSLLFEIADETWHSAGPDAIMKLPDIQSPMDIVALIWDKNSLFVAMIEEPEAVLEMVNKVYTLLTAFLDRWFARYGEEFVAHYPFYYMPSGISVSEDEVGSVSEELFIRFFQPYLEMLSNRYGGIGIHCCANARHQWRNFMEIPDLRLLNINQPGDILNDAVEFFAGHTAQEHIEIFSHKKYFDGRPVWEWPEAAPEGVHLMLNVAADTMDSAMKLCEKLGLACGRC